MTMQGGRAATLVERRHADVRLAVATAARDLFVENHSTSVTVEAIAQRAGVSERTFYRHFPTKADIVMPLLERSMDRLVGALAESAGASTGVVDALVDALTEELATDLEDRRELLELLIRTPEYRLRWESVDDCVVSVLADWLRERSVHPGDDFTRRMTAILILTASRAAYTEWILARPDTGVDELRRLHIRALEAIAGGWRRHCRH
ncbi:TetR family transcriptional regulator [Rhodococcus hoagii]|nr:TetR family transcriptional regulator [Prescottella equi]NKS21173.1 TetR family transcriptional regulator [Prescottella equi]